MVMNKIFLNIILLVSFFAQASHAIDYQAIAYSLFGVSGLALPH